MPREFRSDEVADSKDLLRAVRCVILKSGRSVKVTYLGIRSAHERVWLVEKKTDMATASIFDEERSRTSEK